LKVATEQAQAAITDVDRMIKALDRIQTESQHQVASNVGAVREEIDSLNGRNTSSTHTIYVTKVETNATGGLVGGAGGGVRRFADGGAVAPAFPRMSGGAVPGSGHHDTVPRTLDAGAFVIRKAAAQKYGRGALSRLANGVAHFAAGGRVALLGSPVSTGTDPNNKPSNPKPKPKKNREASEALKMIDLGLRGMNEYSSWLQWKYGASVSLDAKRKTMENFNGYAQRDRRTLEGFIDRKTPTTNERQNIDRIKQTWRQAMAQPLLWGEDLERELIDYMEQNQGQFFRRGGVAKSDTIPAMLTPGEFVVNRQTVARYGAGFFEAINNLSAPARLLAGRALAGIQGFASGGLVQPASRSLPRPSLPDGTPTRTVRVELSSGQQKVNATVDARDEARLLHLLDAARARTA